MYTLLESHSDVNMLLPFVDDIQIQDAVWIQYIGTSLNGIPIVFLNLPTLFTTDKGDYTTDFSVFVKFLSSFPSSISLLIVASHLNAIKLSSFPFFKKLCELVPDTIHQKINTAFIWNPGMCFSSFMVYAKTFLSAEAYCRIVCLKSEKQLHQLISPSLNIRIDKEGNMQCMNILKKQLVNQTSSKEHRRGIRVDMLTQIQQRKQVQCEWEMPLLELQCGEDHIAFFIQQTCSYLEENELNTVGIFRQNGDSQRSLLLMHDIVDGREVIDAIGMYCATVFDICQSMKLYLKEIHLFPLHLYPYIESIQSMTDQQEIAETIQMILQLIDINRFHTLQRVISLFAKIVEHSDKNQMNLNNLLTCTILNLLPESESDKHTCVFRFGKRLKFLSFLIQNQETIFSIGC